MVSASTAWTVCECVRDRSGMLRGRTRLVSVTILYLVLWCVRDHRLMSFLA